MNRYLINKDLKNKIETSESRIRTLEIELFEENEKLRELQYYTTLKDVSEEIIGKEFIVEDEYSSFDSRIYTILEFMPNNKVKCKYTREFMGPEIEEMLEVPFCYLMQLNLKENKIK